MGGPQSVGNGCAQGNAHIDIAKVEPKQFHGNGGAPGDIHKQGMEGKEYGHGEASPARAEVVAHGTAGGSRWSYEGSNPEKQLHESSKMAEQTISAVLFSFPKHAMA